MSLSTGHDFFVYVRMMSAVCIARATQEATVAVNHEWIIDEQSDIDVCNFHHLRRCVIAI